MRRSVYQLHLYVASHFQLFVFLVLTMLAVAQYTRSVSVVVAATAVVGDEPRGQRPGGALSGRPG